MMTTEHTLTLSPAMARAAAEGRKTQHRVLLEPEWFDLPDMPAHWHDAVPSAMPNLHAITTSDGWRKPVFPPYSKGDTMLINDTAYTITHVGVHRVRDISEGDALHEGMVYASDPIDAFRGFWNATHGPDAWARNDWVVALTFRKETP